MEFLIKLVCPNSHCFAFSPSGSYNPKSSQCLIAHFKSGSFKALNQSLAPLSSFLFQTFAYKRLRGSHVKLTSLKRTWSSDLIIEAASLLVEEMEVFIRSGEGPSVSNASSQPEISLGEHNSVVSTSLPGSAHQQPLEYEVFLSFRGPDVRKSFADYLYSYLVRSKIRVFRDEEELHKGEKIAPSLIQAISESKVYIPILTESYASSKWCLQELAKMVECCNEQEQGHIILPIFYFVDPRDVRHQAGPYKVAFEQHSQKHDLETVQEWRQALQEVGQMKGWHVTESDGQGAVVDQIFSEVELYLRNNHMLVIDELVGIDSHAQEVMKLLNLDSGDAIIVGIQGIGGIGKTTIAKAVYEKISTRFNRCCFIENTREMLSKSDGIIALQNKLISCILRDDVQVKDAGEGVKMIRERVCKYKVLIALDDIDDSFEFTRTLGKLGHFSSKSRFIITTRDKRVLELLQECKLYEPKEMSHEDSFQLFSIHAFGMDCPLEDYATLTEEFVKVAGGLPLALKVIGSLMFHRDRHFWEEKLMELKEIPPTSNKVQQSLKISYNDLTRNEKQIFLDIACLFIGQDKESPFHMWASCNFYPESGIRTLILRSLIKIDEGNQFWMHDLLRDLGRAIVIEEDVKHPGKRSRIWSNNDAFNILKNGEGTDQVEMLRIDMRQVGDLKLTAKDFTKLSSLKYLDVMHGTLLGDFSEILPDMRWLRLYECRSIPIDLNMQKVVILDLQGSLVKDDWRGWNRIKEVARSELKVLNLSNCKHLTRVPELSKCKSLEWIELSCCFDMTGELHVGHFKNLKVVRFQGTGISKLAGDIGKLQKLQEIKTAEIVWKEEVPMLPTSLKRLTLPSPRIPNLLDLKDLEELCFMDCGDVVPEITWQFPKLRTLELWDCHCPNGSLLADPKDDNEGARLPSSLTRLVVTCGFNLKILPDLGNLINLTELRLIRTSILEIPSLGELRVLEVLEVSANQSLDNLQGLENLVHLKELILYEYLQGALPSVSNLTNLHKLVINSCPFIYEIHGLGDLGRSLLHLEVRWCPKIQNLEDIQSLEALETLTLESANLFPNLSHLQNLKRLSILCWRQFPEVRGLERLKSLQFLNISDCKSVRRLPDLSGLKNLETLEIQGCKELVEVPGLERLESLQELIMSRCYSIQELPDISALENLEQLDVRKCTELIRVIGLERLESLRKLNMFACKSIKKLPGMSRLKNLRELDLRECSQLTEVKGLERLEYLCNVKMDSLLLAKHRFKLASFGGKQLTRSVLGHLRKRR